METTAEPGLVIRPSCIAEIREVAAPLLREHWQEVAARKDLMVLDPDWDVYEDLEARGRLIQLVAWVGGNLVGYSVSFLMHHLHYRGLLLAQNDVLFITKEHRKGKLGLQLIRATEEAARDNGARMVLWHAKPGTALDALLPRIGYAVHETMYAREV